MKVKAAEVEEEEGDAPSGAAKRHSDAHIDHHRQSIPTLIINCDTHTHTLYN